MVCLKNFIIPFHISIQPFAIAIAITVASADGLHITEKEAIYKQAETWGCAEEDIEIFLKQINNI